MVVTVPLIVAVFQMCIKSVAEWTDTYGIHYWMFLWGNYEKLAWVGFEPTYT